MPYNKIRSQKETLIIKCIISHELNLIRGLRSLQLSALLLFLICISFKSEAQSIGLQVDRAHNVLFGDSLSGDGQRMMWIPSKGAIRAGRSGTAWDVAQIGLNSSAFGNSNFSTGELSMSWGITNSTGVSLSTAWGRGNVVSGEGGTAYGEENKALGKTSTSWGFNNKAIGDYSTVWGGLFDIDIDVSQNPPVFTNLEYGNIARGDHSTVWGIGNYATSSLETVLGAFADTTVTSDHENWDDNHQIFAIGNGTDLANRNNALTVLKNGNVGIDAVTPSAKLHIEEEGTAGSRAEMLALVAGTSKRPTIQFSENPGQTDINGGMSIEYNGTGQGPFNFLSINSIGGSSALAVFNEGNVNVRGFTKFGSSPITGTTAPAIKIVEVTGNVNFASDQKFNISLPSGISGSKVIDVKATIYDSGLGVYYPPNTGTILSNYNMVWTDSQICLTALDGGTQTNLDNETYSITIMYKQ